MERVLERFRAGLDAAVPLAGLWAHGSLALGDYQVGRSDLDLIAVVDSRLSAVQTVAVRDLHRDLIRTERLAAKLHCSYVGTDEIGDVHRRHLTWAHARLLERPVSPVTRRELLQGGLGLHGVAPAELVPSVTDRVLDDFVRTDLSGYWLPATDHPTYWLRDIWVDLGLLTLARAAVTLRERRLISKREAFDVLAEFGAPKNVLDDIRRRRYAEPPRCGPIWRWRRAQLARTFVRTGIGRVLSGGDL